MIGSVVFAAPTTAFFYGSPVPLDSFRHFDQVVVEAENFGDPLPLARQGTEVYAYISVGEAENWRNSAVGLPPSWFIGRNSKWNSRIANLTRTGWREYLLETRMSDLWEKGYRGFFLDTLDSYQRAGLDDSGKGYQRAALVELIEAMHRRFPGVKLLVNRGFEVMPAIAPLLQGVVAESLFAGWDQANGRYTDVTQAERDWLLARLREVRDRYNLPVTVIDYLPPDQRERARETAERIRELGFIPWISNPALDAVGVGAIEPETRTVLALYDGAETPAFRDSRLHRALALPLEHLGLVLQPRDIRAGLPVYPLPGRYAGVVTWFAQDALERPEEYQRWLTAALRSGVPVAILGHIGVRPGRELLEQLGLQPSGSLMPPLTAVQRDGLTGFEAQPIPLRRGFSPLAAADGLTRHLMIRDAAGRLAAAVVTGPFGGLALDPYVQQPGPAGQSRWIVDPFEFLARSLHLKPGPVTDITTLNGQRLLTVEADAEGGERQAEMPRLPLAAEVVRERVLRAYPWPTTVRLVAEHSGRETGDVVMQAILALPNVETVAPRDRSLPEMASSGAFSLTSVAPSGVAEGADFQVYSPGPAETAYTNGWQGPFHGYRRAVAIFDATGHPRRLKPIGIHYHFYSGTKLAGVKALQEVYRWAAEQETCPVWFSEYAQLVEDFQRVSIARTAPFAYEVRGMRRAGTLRLPVEAGWPDLEHSRGVLGAATFGDQRYVHLLPRQGKATLVLRPEPPAKLHLIAANAFVDRWEPAEEGVRVDLKGHVPLRLRIGKPGGTQCILRTADGVQWSGEPVAAGVFAFSLPRKEAVHALIACT